MNTAPYQHTHSIESSPHFPTQRVLDDLLKDCTIEVSTDASVSIVLPARVSRLDFLIAAHMRIRSQFNTELIEEDLLAEFRATPSVAESAPHSTTITLRILRTDPIQYSSTEQSEFLQTFGFTLASREDTTIAFAAFWLARGEDLFSGAAVQTAHRGLLHTTEGLVELDLYRARLAAVVAHSDLVPSPPSKY